MLKPHIVILGAGFGGTYVAKELLAHVKQGRIELTIVNSTNYFLFTPLLHEVATGSLSPTSVAEPLREIFAHTGVRIAQGSVESIDRAHKTIKLSGHHDCVLTYDYLVIATGATSNYYNIPGAEKYTYPLKNLMDAARIRSQIIDSFEQAIFAKDPVERARLLTFVVVGGGATGVETAAELAEFVKGMVKRYYGATKNCDWDDSRTCKPEEPAIDLIHMGGQVLEMFPESLRMSAEKRLRDLGVVLHFKTSVTEVTSRDIKLSTGTTIAAGTIIWTAGVKPVVPRFEADQPQLITGRLAVDEYFRVNSDPHIFALGDAAAYVDRTVLVADPTKTRPLPMLAQVAVRESHTVARNIIASIRGKELHDFSYHSKGSMVSVGQWFAIGEIFSFKISGRFTWWLWRTTYLFKFASWKKRIRIVFEWSLRLFYTRDITKLT